MTGNSFWMECLDGDARIEAADLETVEDLFVAHVDESHDWPYPEEAVRNYARNYAEANVRLTGSVDRLAEIGDIEVHPVTAERIDDWLQLFDHDGFAGNPEWASCYCYEPHRPPTEEQEAPWREIRATMIDRLRSGTTYGYLAYVDGSPAGWVNASLRSEYCLFGPLETDAPEGSQIVGVSCFVVAPPYRRHGVASRLLDRVIEDAAARGADWVEAYPRNQPRTGDPGHFRGPSSLYDARGFTTVEVRERDRIVRRPAGG